MNLKKKRMHVTFSGISLKIYEIGKSAIISEIINRYISKNKKDFKILLGNYLSESEIEKLFIEIGLEKPKKDTKNENGRKVNDHSKRNFVPLEL